MLILAIPNDGIGAERLIGEGNTVESAFSDIQSQDDDIRFEDCTFFKAEKLNVKQHITYSVE